jgi:hypothetical protein
VHVEVNVCAMHRRGRTCIHGLKPFAVELYLHGTATSLPSVRADGPFERAADAATNVLDWTAGLPTETRDSAVPKYSPLSRYRLIGDANCPYLQSGPR